MRTITITSPDKALHSLDGSFIDEWQPTEMDILLDVSPLPFGFAGDELSHLLHIWDKAGRIFRDPALAPPRRYQVGDKVRIVRTGRADKIMTCSTNRDKFHSYILQTAGTRYHHHELERSHDA